MTTLSPPLPSAGLNAWLTYLERLHHQPIDLGLDRIKAVAEQMQLTTPETLVITVAGTNGKGSTVRYLETILLEAGYRTGVYTSPHLHHYAERVRIDAQLLDEAAHVQAFAAIEAARGDISLTYFEFGTLAALWLLKQQAVDVWILEVGLGGRLDAVNIVDADVAVLTSVGIDHVGFLGADRDGIAMEKAGVFRPHRPAIIGEPELPDVVIQHAQQQQIPLQRVGYDFKYRVTDQDTWQFTSRDIVFNQLPMPQLPLPNAATAIAAIAALPLPVAAPAIRDGLVKAKEAGRLQWLAPNAERPAGTLLDVGHNPQAAKFLAKVIRQRYPNYRVLAVVGMLEDKDFSGTLHELQSVVDTWYFADLDEPRGVKAQVLQNAAPKAAVIAGCFASVPEAFSAAQQQAKKDLEQQSLVLVCGSFYTVGKLPITE